MADKPTSPPPAYFVSLSLENVRSFGEKQTISFAREDGRPAQWTIILGDNGVGKTTVLKALAGLSTKKLSNQNYWFPAIASELAEKWNPIRFVGQKTGELLAEVEIGCRLQNKTGENQLSYYKSFIDLPGEDSPNQPYGMGWARLNAESEGLMCYGYGAGRTVGNSTISEAQEAGELYSSLFDDRANLLNPEEWFLRREFSSFKGDKEAADTLKQVQKVLLRVLPDVTDLKTTSENHEQYLELKTSYGWVRLRDMSLGYQTLVVWLTDFSSKLFLRYPNSPNPLEEPAIVLIDEIDLHLHPSWQRKLIGFLSDIFKNTQFIATAHSPLVVQAATDAEANVVLLKREGNQTIVHQNAADVRGWRLDQILTSELFGLETARSLDTEHKLKRRAELLTNTSRTAAENQELVTLTRELNAEPVGETPSEREVNSVLQELRQRLRQQDAPAA